MRNPPVRRSVTETRRASIDRVERVAAQDTWVMGRVTVEGVGESLVNVKFPVTFGEEPLPLLGGGVMLGSPAPQSNMFPTVQAVVAEWDTTNVSGGSGQRDYYKGATLAITTTGRHDEKLAVTFAFVGIALTNIAES